MKRLGGTMSFSTHRKRWKYQMGLNLGGCRWTGAINLMWPLQLEQQHLGKDMFRFNPSVVQVIEQGVLL